MKKKFPFPTHNKTIPQNHNHQTNAPTQAQIKEDDIPQPSPQFQTPTQLQKPISQNTNISNNAQNKDNENLITKPQIISNWTNYYTETDFIRFSSESIPNSQYWLKNNGIPFGCSLTPFPNSETKDTVVKYSFGNGNGKIPQCKCGVFINPYIERDHNMWKCNICNTKNENPSDDLNDTFGKILNNGYQIYDIYANSDFIENSPMPPNFVFIIDISNKNIMLGGITVWLSVLRDVINNKTWWNEERTNFGFISFDKQNVNFFKINQKNGNVQVLSIGGEEAFLPESPCNLLLNFEDNKQYINAFIDLFEDMYLKKSSDEANGIANDRLYTAINCGKMLLKHQGGKLMILNSSTEYYVKGLKDDEVMLRAEALGTSLQKYKICCNVYQLQNQKEEQKVTILNAICEITNGHLHFYKSFDYDLKYDSWYYDLLKSFTNQRGFEGWLRVAVSSPLLLSTYLTHKSTIIANKNLLLPCIDIDQTYSFIFEWLDVKVKCNVNHEDSIPLQTWHTPNFIYVQFSWIYTDIEGIRLIRVFNKKFPVIHSIGDYLKSIDVECASNILVKWFISKIFKSENPENSWAELAQNYFGYAFSGWREAKYHEWLNQLLVWYLGFRKNRICCTEPTKYKFDEDSHNYLKVKILNSTVEEVMNVWVPRLYNLSSLWDCSSEAFNNWYMSPTNSSSKALSEDNIYLLDNGLFLDIHFMRSPKNEDKIKKFFGAKKTFDIVGSYLHTYSSVFEENEFKDDDEIVLYRGFIDFIRSKKQTYQELFFSFQGSASENILKEALIWDRHCNWFRFSYEDYIKMV